MESDQFVGTDGTIPRMDVRSTARIPHTEFFPPPPSPPLQSRWLGNFFDDQRELARFWPVVQNMVVQELRVRYQRSILGFVWTLLNPLLMMATLSCVFSNLMMRSSTDNYTLFLFAGMVPWGFLSNSLVDSAYCIIANEGLIRKIYLPKMVFPLAKVLINLTTFILSLGALFLLLLPMHARFSSTMVLLPVVIVLLAIFVLGLSLLVATANTFYRDCGHLVSVFLQAWYFLTPILFPIEQFRENARWLFLLNPAYYFIELFHGVFEGRWPTIGFLAAAALIASLSLGIGYVAFKSHEDKMVFRL